MIITLAFCSERPARPLCFYVSDQIHSCHQKAPETLGLAALSLRTIASDERKRINLSALEAAITEDRAAGLAPVCVIGTAGTTTTGATDDPPALAATCRREGPCRGDGAVSLGSLRKGAVRHARPALASALPHLHRSGLRPLRRRRQRRRCRPRLCENPQMWYASCDTGVHLCQVLLKELIGIR
jgi:hypothetical protein